MNAEEFAIKFGREVQVVRPEMKGWKPGKLIDFVTEKVREILDDMTVDDATVDEIVAQAKVAYDSFIAPIDLPYVPNIVVEPYVDDKIWDAIEFLLRHYLG